MDLAKDILITEVYPAEAFLVALFYDNPSLYLEYDDNILNKKHFGNKIWQFYFQLGRTITNKGGQILDDITVANAVTELKVEGLYDKFGRYETIQELINEVQNKKSNFNLYYDTVKKYNLLRSLRSVIGNKVIENNDKYDYNKLNADQIANYWLYQIEEIVFQNNNNTFEEQYLLDNLDSFVEKIDKNPEIGLPFNNSKQLTRATSGLLNGELYLFGGHSGRGKTAFMIEKIIMSCIKNKEKLVVIANEESIDRFRQNLLVTIMGTVTKEGFARYRLQEGKFSPEEYEKLQRAIKWVKEATSGNNKLITFVFLENYIMKEVKKIIKHYAKRGVTKFVIDTGKPSEGQSGKPRWEVMADDIKDLYKLCRKNGGLGICIWVNVQLTDAAIRYRYLNEFALGEAKKMKNEASVLLLIRPVWDDELDGGKSQLECFRFRKSEDGKYNKETFKLEPFSDYKYYLLFVGKNRLGQCNETGLPLIVYKVNFNRNSWEEIGMTHLVDSHDYS